MSFYTFQDFVAARNKAEFISLAITEHRASAACCLAKDADAYDHQRNVTICNFVKTIMSNTGSRIIDVTSANNKITSNFFHRLNTQRNMYSLGNGITFPNDGIKQKLGVKIDSRLQQAGYFALIHGVSFVLWNFNQVYVFPLTEFVPLWDEDSGALRAGIRFWQLANDKPLYAVCYEEDGYTKYRSTDDGCLNEIEKKRAYRQRVNYTPADGTEIVGEGNYRALPIAPLWGSKLRQSTLVGMRQSIDSYDLIRSGFANDLSDCAQIYWIISNAGGMAEEDLARFREQLLLRHIANVDGDGGIEIKPYTQEIPYQARGNYLDRIRAGIYEDFGALDVTAVSAANPTATAINAAYQPLDENADDYEYQVIECVQQLLALQGITGSDAVPTFKRNRISNQKEQVEVVAMEAPYLDDETILNKLPNVTPDEVKAILKKKDAETQSKFTTPPETDPPDEDGDDGK